MKTQESLQSLMNKILKTGTRFQKLKITTAEMLNQYNTEFPKWFRELISSFKKEYLDFV